MQYTLDTEEQALLDDVENGDFEVTKNLDKEKELTTKILNKTIKKRRSINIRIPEQDLYHIKHEALEKGIPYQTLIISTLHQRFVKKNTRKNIFA